MKRVLFSLIALVALFSTLLAFSPVSAADKAKDNKALSSACQTTCSSCLKRCEEALKYCESKGGKHAAEAHIKTLKDCIALCKASSDLGSRNSGLASKVRAICAEACKKCADSCASLNDPKLKDCVEICNDCAKSCASDSCCK